MFTKSDMKEVLAAGYSPLYVSWKKWNIAVRDIEQALHDRVYPNLEWAAGGNNCALCYAYVDIDCNGCPLDEGPDQCSTDGTIFSKASIAFERYDDNRCYCNLEACYEAAKKMESHLWDLSIGQNLILKKEVIPPSESKIVNKYGAMPPDSSICNSIEKIMENTYEFLENMGKQESLSVVDWMILEHRAIGHLLCRFAELRLRMAMEMRRKEKQAIH